MSSRFAKEPLATRGSLLRAPQKSLLGDGRDVLNCLKDFFHGWGTALFDPGSRTSSSDFATAAVAPVLVVPLALDQKGPSLSEEGVSSEDSASSDSVVELHFAIPANRALSTFFFLLKRRHWTCRLLWNKRTQLHQKILQARILTWRCASCTLEAELHRQTLRLQQCRDWSCHNAVVQEDPVSSEDFACSDFDVTLHFVIPEGRSSRCTFRLQKGGRASPAEFASAVEAVLVVSFVPNQEDPASTDSASSTVCSMMCSRMRPPGMTWITSRFSSCSATKLQIAGSPVGCSAPTVPVWAQWAPAAAAVSASIHYERGQTRF